LRSRSAYVLLELIVAGQPEEMLKPTQEFGRAQNKPSQILNAMLMKNQTSEAS
jgi:hypothetical protein